MEVNEPWNQTCSNIRSACREGNYNVLKYLLSHGKPVDDLDHRGWRPVHEAVAHNQVQCLKLILEQKTTNINWKTFKGETPLMLAVQHGHEEAIQILLTKGADPNATNSKDETPLMLAAKSQTLSLVRKLLDAGANVNHQSCYDGSTALHYAINPACSNATIITELVARGSNIETKDCKKCTPVFYAARMGFLDGLKVLLGRAKEIGCLQSLINVRGEDGATPFSIALGCFQSLVNMRAEYEADPFSSTFGYLQSLIEGAEAGSTPFRIALQNRFIDCLDFLSQNGADYNTMTTDHVPALNLAIKYGRVNFVKLFLEKMDETIWQCFNYNNINRGTLDRSPLHEAISWGRHDILKLILKTGINPNAVFACTKFYHFPDFPFPPKLPPLGLAVKTRCIEDIVALLDAGAQINLELNGVVCPLLVAVAIGSEEVVEFLLKKGANPNFNRHDEYIDTRMVILPKVKANIMRLLLKHGADIRSAIHPHAFNQKHLTTIAVLQEFVSLAVLQKILDKMCNQVWNLSKAEEQCWKKICEIPRNPPALLHQCRLKIRESLMDNRSDEFPFAKRLQKLPQLPAILSSYLAYD